MLHLAVRNTFHFNKVRVKEMVGQGAREMLPRRRTDSDHAE